MVSSTATERESMNRARFESVVEQMKNSLTKLRETFRFKIQTHLLQYSGMLASMSSGQIVELADKLDGLCTRNQLEKARLNGMTNSPKYMPRHIVELDEVSARTWVGFPNDIRDHLRDPKAEVPMKVRNCVRAVRFTSLKRSSIYRVINPQNPGVGFIPPELQGKEERPINPDYYTLECTETHAGDPILVGVITRPITGLAVAKLRIEHKDATVVISAICNAFDMKALLRTILAKK